MLFSCWVMSSSLWPHGLQHTRPPCPSPTPGVYTNWCPWSRWCHPTISSSVVPFSSRLQSFPASGSFPVSQLFASGGQSTGVSASASIFPVNIQGWFPSRVFVLFYVNNRITKRDIYSSRMLSQMFHFSHTHHTQRIWNLFGKMWIFDKTACQAHSLSLYGSLYLLYACVLNCFMRLWLLATPRFVRLKYFIIELF